MSGLEIAGAVGAWVGASMVVLAEGRRGMAAGLILGGLALAATMTVQPYAAAGLAASAVVAGALRLRDGLPGWSVVPPGTTPRLILCIVVGAVGAFAATTLLPGPGPAPARVAVVLAGVMPAARLLSTTRRGAALAAASLLAVDLAAAEILAGGASAATIAVAAGLAAAVLGLLPAGEEPPAAPARG